MKKFLILALCIAMVGVVFTGCSKADDTPSYFDNSKPVPAED